MILLLWLYLMSIEFFSFCYPINAQSDSLVSPKKKKSLTIYEKHLSMRMKLFKTHPLWLFNNWSFFDEPNYGKKL